MINRKLSMKKKILKKKVKKTAKIINFISKSKKINRIQTEDMEQTRMDALAKEMVDNYYGATKKSFLDSALCLYYLLYRVIQKMMVHTSFPVYQNYHKFACEQNLENYKKWLNKSNERDGGAIHNKVVEAKVGNENDTIH